MFRDNFLVKANRSKHRKHRGQDERGRGGDESWGRTGRRGY